MADRIIELVDQAHENVKSTLSQLPHVYQLLSSTMAAFEKAAPLFHHRHEMLLLGFCGRAAGALIGGVRLAASGQAQESYAVSRFAIENAQYAAHISSDPNPYERAGSYLKRDESDDAKRACRKEFSFGRPAQSVRGLDARVGSRADQLYERTIDLGAHPNAWSTLAGIHRKAIEGGEEVGVYLMGDDPTQLALAMKTAIECALTALNIFRLLRPERFRIAGVEVHINTLENQIEPAFIEFVHPDERFRRGLLL